MKPFQPVWWARGAHAQTILGNLLCRRKCLPGAAVEEVLLHDGDRLVVLVTLPSGPSRGGVLLGHGLGGSASAKYMRSVAGRLVDAGYTVFRMNHRGAGEGCGRAARSYQMGGSGDILETLEQLSRSHSQLPMVAVGFSMSGAMLLKMLGELGDDTPSLLRGAVAVNPPIDVPAAMAALEGPGNRIYHRRFTRLLGALARNNFQNADAHGHLARVRPRSVRDYDRRVTAPLWGYASAEDYYLKASPMPVLKDITLRTVVLASEDDPFIPIEGFRQVTWPPAVTCQVIPHGGHMGYLASSRNPFGFRRWLHDTLVETANRFLSSGGE